MGSGFILLRLRFIFFLLICFSSSANAIHCGGLFQTKESMNLEDILNDFKDHKDLSNLRSHFQGRWVQLNKISKDWVRYQVLGKKGPLQIHFEGLGGQIETSLTNPLLMAQARQGRVLVIEIEGQGLREVHKRIELLGKSKEPTRKIDFDTNLAKLVEALDLIMMAEKLKISDIQSISGHSFGGLKLSQMIEQFHGFDSPLIQFIATGVANHNHRLIDSVGNMQIDFWSQWAQMLMPNADKIAIQKAVQSFSDDPLMKHFENDLIRVESAVSLTMGAAKIDAVHSLKNFPPESRIQILSAEKDNVVFAMLHWELGLAARQSNHNTTMVMVEGVSHFLPQDLNPFQKRAVLDLTQNPSQYQGFYYLKKNGRLQKLNEDQALALYKASSLSTWNNQKEFIKDIFSSIGLTARYPEAWK